MDPSHLVFKQLAEFRLATGNGEGPKAYQGLSQSEPQVLECEHTHTYLDLQTIQKTLQHYYEGTELLFPRWERTEAD